MELPSIEKKKKGLQLEGYISYAWGHLSPLQGVMLNTKDATSNKTQSHLKGIRYGISKGIEMITSKIS